MDAFEFHAPTRVRFGPGSRGQLADILTAGRWSLLSSPSVLEHSGIDAVLGEARRRGAEIGHPTFISPNPRLSEIQAALGRAVRDDSTGVLAIGGGSVLDAGKLMRSALQYGAPAQEALDNLAMVVARDSERPIRLVAVPTTAGTGAEVSQGAIITDDGGVKRAARGSELIPDEAVVDPELTLSLPRRRTAETGFDVLAHAIETYLSRAASPLTEILSLAAVEAASGALLDAVSDGADLEARSTLSLHAWLMGYNLAHASTCLPHRMQYPIGSATDTSHQIGLAALYPSWLRLMSATVPERMGTLMARFRSGLAGRLTDEAWKLGDLDLFRWYLRTLEIEVGLTDLGLDEGDVPALVDDVRGTLDLDPSDPDRQTLERIYRESLAVGS
jgi:alcohol dehydrogenase class IV